MTAEEYRQSYARADYERLSQWQRLRQLCWALNRDGYVKRHFQVSFCWWQWRRWGVDVGQTWEAIHVGPLAIYWLWE